MEIPQEVREKVVNKLNEILKGNGRWLATVGETADAIIPLAQLPIAPATEEEVKQAWVEYCQPRDSHNLRRVLDRFISHRNFPPQVDPLADIIAQEICKGRDAGQTIAETSRKIAAAVRQEHP